MALENATQIQELVNTNPEGSDQLSEADDHMRMIKLCLQNSLPGLTAPWDTTETIKAADPVDPRDLVTLQYLQSSGGVQIGFPTIWILDQLPVVAGAEFAVLDGRALVRLDYPVLFALYGVTYGLGDGVLTFNIPDFRGLFLRSMDAGAGIDPDSASRTDRGDGVVGDAVGTKQLDAVAAHEHDFQVNMAESQVGQGWIVTGAEDFTFHSSFDAQFNTDLWTTGGRTSIENRPTNVYVEYIMRIA